MNRDDNERMRSADAARRIEWWRLPLPELLRQCDEDRYRASGPGGQHRNKTDSAIRLRHRPTGVIVTATERRSQHENRSRALKRLRIALALERRQPIDASRLPTFADRLASLGPRPKVDDDECLSAVALILDVIDASSGRASEAAQRLGVSTAQLTDFLLVSEEWWQAVQELRQSHGLKPLRRRR